MRVAILAAMLIAVLSGRPMGALQAAKRPGGEGQMTRWEARLELLRPDLPMAYFELAEEIADRADSEEETALARRLFALAALLDSMGLGRSSCLALADLAEEEREERRLRALASLLRTPGWSVDLAPDIAGGERMAEVNTASALVVSEAISFYRSGQGARATSALRKHGASDLLRRHEEHVPGGMRRFVEDCRHYRGRLRPTLQEGEQMRLLQLEAALLTADDPSWSAALLLNRGEPLIEVDPNRLASTLGVDATRPYFRHGQWTSSP